MIMDDYLRFCDCGYAGHGFAELAHDDKIPPKTTNNSRTDTNFFIFIRFLKQKKIYTTDLRI
jgi:hypothetical protein